MKRNLTRVSVIIPCFNQARYLAAAVDSVLRQTYENVEVIVINDGSADDTKEVAKNYLGQIIYLEQTNQGLSLARNNGLQLASGEYVKFLDSDDALAPDMIEREVNALEKQRVDITAGSYIECNSDLKPGREILGPNYGMDAFHELLAGNSVPPLCFLFRRDCLSQVGGFDQNMSPHEDWDILLRLAFAGCKFGIAEEAKAFYRVHPASLSANYDRMYDSAIRVIGKNGSIHQGCDLCRQLAIRGRIMQREVYLRRSLIAISKMQSLKSRLNRLVKIFRRVCSDFAFIHVIVSMLIRQPSRVLAKERGTAAKDQQ